MPEATFREELEALINRHSKESGSNTADFILAEYLDKCLTLFDETVKRRDEWYGVNLYPGCSVRELTQAAFNVKRNEGPFGVSETATARRRDADFAEAARHAAADDEPVTIERPVSGEIG